MKKDPFYLLYDNYYSIYNIIENEDLMMHEKINYLFDVININIKNINFIIENKHNYKVVEKEKFFSDLEIFINYLNYIPLKVTSDLNTLDSLDAKIHLLKKKFSEFKETNLTSINNLNFLSMNESIYFDLIKENISDHTNYDNKISLLNKDQKYYNLKLFNKCLDIYLLNNDEPVWIDENDTLNVINWVLDKKIFNSRLTVQNREFSVHQQAKALF